MSENKEQFYQAEEFNSYVMDEQLDYERMQQDGFGEKQYDSGIKMGSPPNEVMDETLEERPNTSTAFRVEKKAFSKNRKIKRPRRINRKSHYWEDKKEPIQTAISKPYHDFAISGDENTFSQRKVFSLVSDKRSESYETVQKIRDISVSKQKYLQEYHQNIEDEEMLFWENIENTESKENSSKPFIHTPNFKTDTATEEIDGQQYREDITTALDDGIIGNKNISDGDRKFLYADSSDADLHSRKNALMKDRFEGIKKHQKGLYENKNVGEFKVVLRGNIRTAIQKRNSGFSKMSLKQKIMASERERAFDEQKVEESFDLKPKDEDFKIQSDFEKEKDNTRSLKSEDKFTSKKLNFRDEKKDDTNSEDINEETENDPTKRRDFFQYYFLSGERSGNGKRLTMTLRYISDSSRRFIVSHKYEDDVARGFAFTYEHVWIHGMGFMSDVMNRQIQIYLKNKGYQMLASKKYDYLRSDLRSVLAPIIKTEIENRGGTETDILRVLNPKNERELEILFRALQKELISRDHDVFNQKYLRDVLNENILSDIEVKLIKGYLATGQVRKYLYGARIRNHVVSSGKRMNASTLRYYKKVSNEDLVLGTLYQAQNIRRSIKNTYRSAATVGNLMKYGIHLAFVPVRFTGENIVEPVVTHSMDRFQKTDTGQRIWNSSRNISKKIKENNKRIHKTRAVRTLRNISKSGKNMFLGVVSIVTAVKKFIHRLSSYFSMVFAFIPIMLVTLFVLLLLLTSLAAFYGSDEELIEDDTATMTVQQYVDVLTECHTQFQSEIQKLYEDSSYETVTVNYVNEKNEQIYQMLLGQEDGGSPSEVIMQNMVITENNIIEILCMTFSLFGFNIEDYSYEEESSTAILKKDMAMLENFLEENGFSNEDYEGTFQRLIRCYMVALFNGSHKMSKRVEVTYCGGCVKHIYYDDEGNMHEYYSCSGHKHLYVTVTTYYFDELFRVRLEQNPASAGYAGSIIGSSTIEKVWNAMLNAGYTEQAAAGAIGNLMYESGGGPNDINLHAVEDGSGEGIGMVQWSFDRKQKFLSFLESRGVQWPNASADLQIEFMMQELESGEWNCWIEQYGSEYDVSLDTFKSCTNVTDATWYWCACYERCWYKSSAMETRITYARNIYNTYHGKDFGETLPEGTDLTALGDFLITYYCPCVLCSEGYGTQTATGATCRANHTIAVDPSVIPYGTKVLINGIVYTAEDCGGGVNGNHIDIYVDTHAETYEGGKHYSPVYIVNAG